MKRQINGYMTSEQIEKGNHYLSGMVDDTISCWILTRIKGKSASMVCDGNISIPLMEELDKRILHFIIK